MSRAFTTFVGIDLGGARGKTTAVARLEASADGGVHVCQVGTRRDGLRAEVDGRAGRRVRGPW